MKKDTIHKMALCGIFAALAAVCSWISVPTAVPFTLQTFAVFCALAILGGRWGTLSVAVYLLVGLAGIPVFAGFSGGYAAFLTPSGGFLPGFLFMGLVYWAVTALFGEKPAVTVVALIAGMAVCYVIGAAWFMAYFSNSGTPMGLTESLALCVLPYLPADGLKLALAMVISRRVKMYVRTA